MENIRNRKPILSTRRNHALEHATLQVLMEKGHPNRLGGMSDPRGFWVLGEIDPETLFNAVEEARTRLLNGERELAIHPNCGTNLAAAGVVGGILAWLAMLGMKKNWRDRFDRLANVVTLVTLGLIVAQPLGPKLQQSLTTDANIEGLRAVQVKRVNHEGMPIHRVTTVS